jgi:hypothetical protein
MNLFLLSILETRVIHFLPHPTCLQERAMPEEKTSDSYMFRALRCSERNPLIPLHTEQRRPYSFKNVNISPFVIYYNKEF